MAENAPDWVPWDAGKWLNSTHYMDRTTEYVYFRLVNIAYEQGSSTVGKSDAFNAQRCKCTLDEYKQAIEVLESDFEKIERTDDGVFIPSVERRLSEASTRIQAKQVGAAKARMKRQLKAEGRSPDEIELIISENFPDDQNSIKKERKTDRQTDKQTDRQNVLELVHENPDPLQLAVECFNSVLGDCLPRVRDLTDSRKTSLAARIKTLGGAEQWHMFCEYVSQSDFLTGRKTEFRANFDWLLKPSNFAKVLEGNYENRQPAPGEGTLQQQLKAMK